MSLRARLLLGIAVIAAVLVLTGVVVARSTRTHLVDQIDARLAASAPFRGPFGPPGFVPPGQQQRPQGDDREAADGEGAGSGSAGFSALYVGFLSDGTLVTLNLPNLTGEDAPAPSVPTEALQAAARGGGARVLTVGSEGSELRYRLRIDYDERIDTVLVVGLPLDDVDAAVSRLVRLEIVATLGILAVMALVTFWVLRLGVRPVKQMTGTASAIAGGDLSHRVPSMAPGTEAAELGDALNRMLGRIEEAFDERTRSEERLRRFVADASHELRTPVTTIRGYAELYRTGGLADPAELSEALRRTEQEAVRMGTLVEDMLLLARLDRGRPLDIAEVRLDRLAEDAVRDGSAVEPDRPIGCVVPGPVTVPGDEGRLRQVFANLVSNCFTHTPAGTPVEVRVFREDDRAVVEVHDEGPGMPAEVAAQAFEGFFREDASRSRARGGSGLGLAIVKAIAVAHGGRASLTTAPGEGTTVRIELPTASREPEPAGDLGEEREAAGTAGATSVVAPPAGGCG